MQALGIPTTDPADIPDNPDGNMESVRTERTGMSKWFNAAYAIIAKLDGGTPEQRSLGGRESRVYHFSDLEVRDGEQGMTFSGYAALFNTDSVPLPFIERIAPGAFKRSLQSRNEIKLLWNHDAGEPLASLRGGSLKLTEDDHGLKVDAVLANTTRGRDTAELIRTGVINSMSIGFNVIKDSWSNDGSVRTLEAVRLFEASIVAFPAYESTAGTVSVRSIDADKLAESLAKLEAGDELDADQADLLKDVVTRLSTKETVDDEPEPVGDMLALAKAKMFLLEKSA